MALYFEFSTELNTWYRNSDFKDLGFNTTFITTADSAKNMDLKYFSNYWIDIALSINALQDNQKSKKKNKTTTLLSNFAIDISKDTV